MTTELSGDAKEPGSAAKLLSTGKDRFLRGRHYWAPFGVGVALVVVAIVMEALVPGFFPKPEADSSRLVGLDFTVLFLRELGIAFLVAGIIIRVVEKRAKEHDSQRADRLRREVAHDAIFSIYGLRHRTDFINAAVERNLQARIVRENMTMEYEVRPPTKDEAELVLPGAGDDALRRFVVLRMDLTYTFRNVASEEVTLRIPYTIPLRQGSGARKLTKANWVCIGGTELSEHEIGAAAEERAEELVYQWIRTLPPGETLEMNISAQCLKERSDSEAWGCLFPTMGDITLSLKVPEGLSFGVRDHSNATLIERRAKMPSLTSKTWTMVGPLLTHNSIIFWWRIPEDDATDETSRPAEFTQESDLAESGKPYCKEPQRGFWSWLFRRS